MTQISSFSIGDHIVFIEMSQSHTVLIKGFIEIARNADLI